MEKFCTKCGSPVAEGLRFCSKCGTPVAEAAAPPPASAAPSVTAAGAPSAAAPAPKKGSPVLKIVLIVVLVILFLIVASIGACVYIGFRVRQRIRTMEQTHSTLQTGTGAGEVHVETGGGPKAAAAATQDIPAYPGSTVTSSGVTIGGPQGGLSGQEFESSDSMDKVVAFYKDKLGSKASFSESGGKATFTIFTTNGISAVTISHDESSGKTKINIARLGK